MNANPSFNPTNGEATRNAAVTGKIPPGLTLLGFRDASRLAFRDRHSQPAQQPAKPEAQPAKADVKLEHVHAAISGLVALGSIALLALGR